MSDTNNSSDSFALGRLAKWVSKYKTFELRDGGINPGNEASIRLKNGYREVYLDEWDFQPKYTNEQLDYFEANWKTVDYPAFVTVAYEDLINRALDLWENDPRPKVYEIFCTATKAGAWDKLIWTTGEYVYLPVIATDSNLGLNILAVTEKGFACGEPNLNPNPNTNLNTNEK